MKREETRPITFCFGLCSLSVVFSATAASAQKPSLPWETFGGGRLAPVRWSAGCGIDSLYLGLKIMGMDADYYDLIERAKIERPEQWINIGTLWRLTREVGAHGLAVRIEGRKKEAELRKLLKESARRTAILHLSTYEGQEQHLVCAFLSRKGEIEIAGGRTYQRELVKTWRKRWSGVTLLLSKQPFQKHNATGKSAPHIDFDKTVLDFGEVTNSSRLEYSFKIRNTGNSMLHIEDVLASCSCTKSDLASNIVLPGGSVALTGDVGFGTKPGPGEVGLTIVSDDPERPRVDLALKWITGPPLLQLDPPSVTMSDIVPGGRKSVAVKLKFRKDASIEPNDIAIRVNSDWLDATLLPDGETLEITASPRWSSGKQSERVVLTFDSSKSRVTLPVEVKVVPTIIVTPTKLFCARKSDKQLVTRKIGLCPASDKDSFEVLSASIHNIPGCVMISEEPTKPNAWNLDVQLGPFEESGGAFLVGHIAVKTSHSNMTQIQIPVFVN